MFPVHGVSLGSHPGDQNTQIPSPEHCGVKCSQQVLLCIAVGGVTIRILTRSPIKVNVGRSTVLPCWLSPPQSSKTLDITWHHSDHPDAPILIYQLNQTVPAAENQFFQGRVSLGPKDAESDGAASGDVSLRLLNATLSDAGEYTCHVSDDEDYDVGSVTLTVLSEYHKFQWMISVLLTV